MRGGAVSAPCWVYSQRYDNWTADALPERNFARKQALTSAGGVTGVGQPAKQTAGCHVERIKQKHVGHRFARHANPAK